MNDTHPRRRAPRPGRARKRAIREQAARTGVPYSVAARVIAELGLQPGESIASHGRTIYPRDPFRQSVVERRARRSFAERLADTRRAAVLPQGRAQHLVDRFPPGRGRAGTGVGQLYHGKGRPELLTMLYLTVAVESPSLLPDPGNVAWVAEMGEETAVDLECALADRAARALLETDSAQLWPRLTAALGRAAAGPGPLRQVAERLAAIMARWETRPRRRPVETSPGDGRVPVESSPADGRVPVESSSADGRVPAEPSRADQRVPAEPSARDRVALDKPAQPGMGEPAQPSTDPARTEARGTSHGGVGEAPHASTDPLRAGTDGPDRLPHPRRCAPGEPLSAGQGEPSTIGGSEAGELLPDVEEAPTSAGRDTPTELMRQASAGVARQAPTGLTHHTPTEPAHQTPTEPTHQTPAELALPFVLAPPFDGVRQILDALLMVADDGHAPGTRVRVLAGPHRDRFATIVGAVWGAVGPPVGYRIQVDGCTGTLGMAAGELIVLAGQESVHA